MNNTTRSCFFMTLICNSWIIDCMKLSEESSGFPQIPARVYLPPLRDPRFENPQFNRNFQTVFSSDQQIVSSPSVEHQHPNGFQHRPIIARQNYPIIGESQRHLQFVVSNVPREIDECRESYCAFGKNFSRSLSALGNRNSLRLVTQPELSSPFTATKIDRTITNHTSIPTWIQHERKFDEDARNAVTEKLLTRLMHSWQRNEIKSDPVNHRHRNLNPSGDLDVEQLSNHRLDNNASTVEVPRPFSKMQDPVISKKILNENIKPIYEANSEHDTHYYATDYRYHYANPDSNSLRMYPTKYFQLWDSDRSFGEALERYLIKNALHSDYDVRNYNSEQHPPPNPILALLLSNYGKYLPNPLKPRPYAYSAVNNIHNTKPFGSYKLTLE